MFDPLTLIVAKAKALGLVAGTAMVVTVGGGSAVAITAVSSDSELTNDVVAEEVLSSEETPALDEVLVTPTITETEELEDEGEGEEVEPDVETDLNADGLADETGLPVGFVCDDSKNHGQNVSSFASTHRGPGHGKLVSAIAKSDCGKTAEEETEVEDAEETEVEETEVEESEVEETEADADEQAAKKADKKAAKSQKKAGKSGAKGNKGGGKGNGKK